MCITSFIIQMCCSFAVCYQANPINLIPLYSITCLFIAEMESTILNSQLTYWLLSFDFRTIDRTHLAIRPTLRKIILRSKNCAATILLIFSKTKQFLTWNSKHILIDCVSVFFIVNFNDSIAIAPIFPKFDLIPQHLAVKINTLVSLLFTEFDLKTKKNTFSFSLFFFCVCLQVRLIIILAVYSAHSRYLCVLAELNWIEISSTLYKKKVEDASCKG